MNEHNDQWQDYFADVGLWHKSSRHVERTYVLGFIGSIALTLSAYAISVYHLVSTDVLIPLVLVLACMQFMTQVLGFLHVSGAPSSRNRLIALLYCALMVIVLVIGSMWIMSSLGARMVPDDAQMEQYMQRQQGI